MPRSWREAISSQLSKENVGGFVLAMETHLAMFFFVPGFKFRHYQKGAKFTLDVISKGYLNHVFKNETSN